MLSFALVARVLFNYEVWWRFSQVRTILWYSIENDTKAEVMPHEATLL